MVVTCNTLALPRWEPPAAFQLEKQLAVFRLQVSAHEWRLPALRPLLPAAELLRASRYHRPADGARFVLARAALRILLGKYTHEKPGNLRFASGLNKKPYLPEASQVHFNVSHSHDWILLAIAPAEVGVDVEYLQPQLDFQDILAHSFSPPEQEFIGRGPASRPRFYQSWTRKEALAKATGQGLDADFPGLPALDGRHYLASSPASPPANWLVSSFEAAPGYPAAIAYPVASPALALGFYNVGSDLLAGW